jgi:hypothetical protein
MQITFLPHAVPHLIRHTLASAQLLVRRASLWTSTLKVCMANMQIGVGVGAGASAEEGVLDVEEDNIPSASTNATSLVTPRTERFSRRRVSGIHIPRTLVRYVHLPFSTPIKRTV